MLTAGDNKVQLVPMLGSWVHPGYTVLLLDCKECIGYAELIMRAELKELLTIFIALADTCMPMHELEREGYCW